STTASEPATPNNPITMSPTDNSVTAGPTSTTTPAPSAPSSPPPGYIPSATKTSRKLTPTAATFTRTCPAANADGAHDWTTKSSNVPLPPGASRQAPSGSRSPGCELTGLSRAPYAMPLRTNNWGSPLATTDPTSTDPSESTSTTRPGCSACAERTKPQTAAPAKSVTSSPGNPTTPRVNTANTPEPSASHDCSCPNAAWVAARTDPSMSWPSGSGSHTT